MSNASDKPTHTNRLAKETSPYLLQHAHNPVDWYPWGEEAFERARRENKPIFLSVGYSTCYWCHVMERQSFENDAVARVMNEHFVNIKVDREERPDVDQLYMSAVQVMTRHGGWPMSVWLTPDLRPFYGGTYFPPTDMHGRPGFVTVLKALSDAFQNRKVDVNQSADQLKDILTQLAEPGDRDAITIDGNTIAALVRQSTSDYDPDQGGFGGAPKFPRETLLEMLLTYMRDGAKDDGPTIEKLRPQIFHTFNAMALGGIRDQLGGGFHRYSTDAKWLVPHFEIMLYDNAMLGWCYVEAFKQTGDAFLAEVARGVFDFVLREMTSPDGAFYTALDAEVDAQEGMPYIWTAEEVSATLTAGAFSGAEVERFLAAYGLDDGPNFADPHHGAGVPEKNVLFVADRELIEANATLFAKMRPVLKAERDRRKQPLLDTKIITSWNALMIRALAYGGAILGDHRYTDAAARAATFLLKNHRDSDGRVYRASRDGRAKYLGFLDDYAYLLQALLALPTGGEWEERAKDLARVMKQQFHDPKHGGFYFSSADATDLIVRQKVSSDSPLPSGNAVAALALMDLGDLDAALGTLECFAGQLRSQAEGMSAMLQAATRWTRDQGPLVISANKTTATSARPASVADTAQTIVIARAKQIAPAQWTVIVSIAAGYHLNSHAPPAGLVATTLNVRGAEIAAIEYPTGEKQRVPFADEAVELYENEFAIRATLRERGKDISMSLTYQACDDSACLPPTTIEVTME